MLASTALRRTFTASTRVAARPTAAANISIYKPIFTPSFFQQTAKMSGTPGKKGVHNLEA